MEVAVVKKTHETSPATSTPQMDWRIWRRLPVELLERVLSCLPLEDFLYLRSTCKHFRSLIFSPLFLSKHITPSSSPISSFILLSHPQSFDYLLYDTVLNTWRNLGLPLSRSLFFKPLHTTANCLLCFSAAPDPSNSAFLIHNFLSGSTRTVEFPKYPFDFDFPTVITNSSGYKLFCLSSGSSSSHAYAYVYDSESCHWTRYDGFQRTLGESYHQQGVFFDGSLYFVTQEPFSIVSFDLCTGNWERLEVDLPKKLAFVRLAAGNGGGEGENRLFVLGGFGTNGISRCLMVWELIVKERKLNEVAIVPRMMCKKFGSVYYHNYELINCFWHQGMICVCCFTWPEVLYYKVSTKTWHWLPDPPSLPEKWSNGFKWYSFAPELYALV